MGSCFPDLGTETSVNKHGILSDAKSCSRHKVGGKEHICFFSQVGHKGNKWIGFACIEDGTKGLYVGNRVAVTDDFNIVT